MGQAALSEDELYYTDMPLGEVLRRTREHYGQSLTDIERALRIRASQIEAIESGHVEKLPGRVYAIGFVRSYAEYLGLDGDRMVHLFKTQAAGKSIDPKLAFPVAASESRTPPVWLVIISLIVSVLIVTGWWGMHARDRSLVEEVPPVPLDMKAKSPPFDEAVQVPDAARIGTEPYGPALPAPQDNMTVIEAAPEEGIVLNITHNTWVEIRDKDGKALVSQVLNAGDQYYVPDRPDLTMSLGNAGGVILEVDGQPLSPIGKLGDVRRSISLDVEYLKKNYAITPE